MINFDSPVSLSLATAINTISDRMHADTIACLDGLMYSFRAGDWFRWCVIDRDGHRSHMTIDQYQSFGY